MTVTRTNAIAAGIMALVASLFPFLIIIGVLDWTGEQTAACTLVIGNLVTLAGLLFSGTPAANVPQGP